MAVGFFAKTGSRRFIRFMSNNIRTSDTAISTSKIQDINFNINNKLNNKGAHDPLEHHDYFNVRHSFTLQDLFTNRVHFGHKSIVRNEYAKPFLFGCRLGMDIINLEQTASLLGDALNFTAHIAFRQGIIMFMTRSLQNIATVEKMAMHCGEYSHCRKWRLGTFTNSAVQYGATTRLPDLCIFLSTLDDVFEQHLAVTESAKMNIPVIGIIDSNCDPRLITYPVPGNDDSPDAVRFYMQLFADAVMKGKQAHAIVNSVSGDETTNIILK